MTYDLHGQWDAHNQYAQEGCDTGNCLRTQVNLTETSQSLAMITKAGVPAHKIVVGVTSYGRSFAMEQPGCWGPNCKSTGTRLDSHATPGRCTGTAGYIADAEINEIIRGGSGGSSAKRQSRVVTHFLDTGSNSDILVYDDNQWVGYMSEKTKQIRSALYASWGMGGTTDWASDLQEFHDPPKPAKDWPSFIARAASGENPKEDTNTNIGNWKNFDCTVDVISNPFNHAPSDRWKAVDADSAWEEVKTKYKNDASHGRRFIESVQQTLKMGAEMGCWTLLGETDRCDGSMSCEKAADSELSGPAAQLIWNSLIKIHKMYHSYYDALSDATSLLSMAVDDMEDTFAPIPVPKDNQWLNILTDLLTMGTLATAGPFFNGFVKQMHAFANPTTFDNAKQLTMDLVGQSTTLAKDLLEDPGPDKWTPQEQNKFSHYIGQVIFGWMNTTEFAVKSLFSGKPDPLQVLEDAIKDGKFIEGQRDGEVPEKDTTATELRANILKFVCGYSIPILWRRSKTYAFVLDSGAGCDGYPLGKYLESSTADETGVCFEGRRYYLVHPDGAHSVCECVGPGGPGPCPPVCRPNKFSAPVGLGELERFGGVTKEDLVIGAVRTWKAGGAMADPIKNEITKWDLVDANITTPGFVNLPVCSPDRAYQSWETADDKGKDYPCGIPPGKDLCGMSTFEDQTSSASPTVSDCEQIVRNIEGDPSTDFTRAITGHHEILKFGSCAFGVERTGGTGGAVMFKGGGQDVIDIINDSIKKFGSSGKVGAKGVMPCDGTTAGTTVKVLWGIY